MRSFNLNILLLLLILFAGRVCGQILPFHSYNIEQGLVSDALTSLFQDSNGYLWIGTGDGVSIYDGTTFRSLRVTDGLPLNNVTHITESHHTLGTMLFGTWGGGISRLSDGLFTTLLPDSSSRAKTIRDVEEDHQGTLWCIAEPGVYKCSNGRFTFLSETYDATDLFIARDSLVWIAVGRRVVLLAPGSGTEIQRFEIPGSGEIMVMHEDRNGSTWIATTDSLLIQVVDRKVIAHRSIPFGTVHRITDDAHGKIWLTTEDGLLGISRDAAFSSPFIRYSEENGLRSNSLSSCLVDFEDNLWIGTKDAGLIRLSDRNVYSFPLQGIPESYNNSKAVTDNRGHIWMIIEGAIVEIWKDNTGNWTTHRNRIPIEHGESILTIARDNAGHLWVDTRRRIESFEIDSVSDGPSVLRLTGAMEPGVQLPAGPRFFFVVDSKQNLWLSVVGEGVYKIPSRNRSVPVKHYSLKSGLPSNDIRAIYEDRRHNIWFGSVAEGLAVIREGSDSVTERYTSAGGLPDELIRAVADDKNGKMWIGTRRKGIEISSAGKFTGISVEDGLLGAAVWALAMDDANDLVWVGTSQGVQKISMTNLLPIGSNSLLVGKPVSSLGTYASQFLWYVTKDALTVYEFQSEMVNRSSPRTRITKVMVNAHPVSISSSPDFSYDENLFTLEYVGITFRETDAVRYQCRLLGAEEEWQLPTSQRNVTYASLSPGSYTFEVRTINADGVMNDPPARVSFTISTPFWARWWFIGCCIVIVVGLAAVIVRIRVRRLLEIERLRSRIARDLHDEIGSNLSSIAMASDLLRRRPELGDQERSKLSEISSVALGTVKDMKDIVWLIRPGNDTLDNLFLRMKDTAGTMLDGYHYTLNFPRNTDERKVTLDWKRNMYLIYKETLTNIMKHARATAVEIDVLVQENSVSLLIKDNGIGFDPGTKKNGNGLRNLHERALLLRATFEIDTRVGAGTTIKLKTQIT